MVTIPAARLASCRFNTLPGKLKIAELFFDVPLDYSRPTGKKIRIFARAAEKLERPIVSNASKGDDEHLPWMVYVTGGPGFGAPMPQDAAWTGFILDRGYKILYFDHRGMGLSTPVTAATLAQQGTHQQQADYLKLFRADSAVKDLEAIRQCLTAEYAEEKKKWSVMGQSYGGFVVLNYLSKFPNGLREAFTFGGLPPITQRVPDNAIRKLFVRVQSRNEKYYAKYPEDRERVRSVVEWLREKGGVELPDGGKLDVQRFLMMGFGFGAHGGLDRVHDCALRAANDLETFGFLTRPTMAQIVGQVLPFDEHALYALIHEALYCQGKPSNWAFSRMLMEFPRFSPKTTEDSIFFTGEMVFWEVFETYSELKPLLPVANILASFADWPDLYDLEQLKKNEVPLYAATYIDDMYVEFDYAQETAALVKGCKTYVTNAMYHNAIRSKMDEVMKAVFALRDDSID